MTSGSSLSSRRTRYRLSWRVLAGTDLLRDPRFADPAKLAANMGQLTAILDEIFSAQPMAHWREVFDKAHVTYGLVLDPHDVIKDPQLSENGIIVPLAGAGGNLKSTISSPIQVHGVTKAPAKRAPELGEHNEEILKELGFDTKEIEGFRASGTLGKQKEQVKGTEYHSTHQKKPNSRIDPQETASLPPNFEAALLTLNLHLELAYCLASMFIYYFS